MSSATQANNKVDSVESDAQALNEATTCVAFIVRSCRRFSWIRRTDLTDLARTRFSAARDAEVVGGVAKATDLSGQTIYRTGSCKSEGWASDLESVIASKFSPAGRHHELHICVSFIRTLSQLCIRTYQTAKYKKA